METKQTTDILSTSERQKLVLFSHGPNLHDATGNCQAAIMPPP